MWDIIINCTFIPTYYINNKVVNKPYFLWTKENDIQIQLDFKTKYLMTSALRTIECHYVFNFISSKEVWDTLEMIHGYFPKIKQERMNIQMEKWNTK